ncbi:MAG: DUF92 domain-containing protein [Acidobacteriota bacterium]
MVSSTERGAHPARRGGERRDREPVAGASLTRWWGRPLPPGEGARKLVHAAMGCFGLALPFLAWWEAAACALAAFLFNWIALPRLLGHRLASTRSGASDRGVLLYPLVVLALVLMFRERLEYAAFGWGVLAFGDAAAGVVGMKWGARALPWNAGKTWAGLGGFLAGAGIGGALLAGWSCAVRYPLGPGLTTFPGGGVAAWGAFWLAIAPVPLVAGAVLESVPHGLDDNILPALTVPLLMALPLMFPPEILPTPRSVLLALAINGGCAVAAWWGRALQPGGIAVAWLMGVLTWLAFGWRAFCLLLAFLVLGLAATFLGYGRKARAGTAERSGGRRDAGEVFGKGGILLLLATQAIAFALARGIDVARFPAYGWVLAATLAAATADTLATELGGLLGRRPFTLVPFRVVAPGTSGAVSVPGVVAAVVGAALIAALAAAIGLLGPSPLGLAVLCAGAATASTLVESLLPAIGEASHLGKNLVVTLLPIILVYAALGIQP